ncbi:uncharacterized protein LOC9661390 isoform X2 [Selaginella moellendorffii]|uniref:uncharacterized protein LOC9661390 isoform X2 n=1 Tax=Selaginella moellendorffii TaxID=88036 RepID=UPI000D1CC158|nr:uncharacterized protein LOC9661390 isoform X2 [Selaginella moellendorffii]|eukprot:XP_024515785.1 uncharacterized protein LOC9661390 isoform X2 [Selaginella moellendorffii]
MSSILSEGDAESSRSGLDRREPRGPDALVIAFRIFSALTAISALLCTAVSVISVVRAFKHGRDIFEGILRCYAVVIALFVAVAETEWEFFLKFWRVLEYWVGRVMTKALSDEHKDRAYQVVFSEVASGMLLGCGAVYVVAGLLCIRKFKRSRIEKSKEREKAAKDLEELEKRRGELQGLLSARG